MKESIIEQIPGTWLLVSMKIIHSNGVTNDMYGENPLGISMFDNSGYMNAQMGSSKRSDFITSSLNSGTSEEITSAYQTYMAFYGRYKEKSPGILTVQIEDCLFPNWKGIEIIRYAEISGNLLTLSTPETKTGSDNPYVKAIWRKV
jgi:hypothetical protein